MVSAFSPSLLFTARFASLAPIPTFPGWETIQKIVRHTVTWLVFFALQKSKGKGHSLLTSRTKFIFSCTLSVYTWHFCWALSWIPQKIKLDSANMHHLLRTLSLTRDLSTVYAEHQNFTLMWLAHFFHILQNSKQVSKAANTM